MIILGIETSCDETAVALVEDGEKILGGLVSSQLDIHRSFGGVVPELASRAHLETLVPLLNQLWEESGSGPEAVGAVAFTRGPGLIGALLVGTSLAKALSYAWKVPLLGVHHLKAHLYAPCLEGNFPAFPLVGMVVSGGHTLLVHASSWHQSRLLGGTRDDAAGEAFDKVAGLLGLAYPGGPSIEKAARKGDEKIFRFPRGMMKSDNLDFSFSGLKTAVRYELKRMEKENIRYRKEDVAAGFQKAVVDVLVEKLRRAVRQTGVKTLVLGGGVARNALLRQKVEEAFDPKRFRLLIPAPDLCSDNAAVIAGLAHLKLEEGEVDGWAVDADPNLPWGKGLI